MDVPVELLLKANLVDEVEVRRASAARRAAGSSLVDVLLAQGAFSVEELEDALRRQLGVEVLWKLEPLDVEGHVLGLLPPERCREMRVLPLSVDDAETLRLAMADPTDLETVDHVRFLTGLSVEPVLVSDRELERGFAALLADEGAADPAPLPSPVTEPAQGPALDRLAAPANLDGAGVTEAPIVALVNALLKQAVLMGASDVHVEPKEAHVQVRYRIDGVLVPRDPIPRRHAAAVTARLKILARLDITERRRPQDGSFVVEVDGRRVDFRVSSFPTIHGQKVVLRILDRASTRLGFDQLGFPPHVADAIRRVMRCREGLFLVTGPTGSGKSTTLYTLLAEMDGTGQNIVTLEDPVEYQLETTTQSQVNPALGFTFAEALRCVLRQDPDVVLLGEIRDLETARTAIQAALTGHLVFSTLHTNSAPESLVRLHDMGVPTFLLHAGLRGALAQRLARRLCQDCRAPYQPTGEVRAELAAHGVDLAEDGVLWRPVGCRACNDIGFRGRMGVYELFEMTRDVQQALTRDPALETLHDVAKAAGLRTLRHDALRRVAAGATSLEEAYRVT